MKITIKQLEIFDAVATTGSVTRAAETLGMSQSAVSGSLTDLQVIIARPLFVRSRGRLQITDEGKRLRLHARSILAEVQEFESGVNAPLSGTLRIGASAMIAETALPDICVQFLAKYPGVQLDIQSATAGELFQSLAHFELETAVIEYFPELANLELTPWRTDELWLVAAPNHPLAERRTLRMRDLIGVGWYTREPHSSVSSRLRVILHEVVGQMNILFSATNNTAVKLAARAGGGIACLSRGMVEADISAGQLVRLNVVDFHFTRTLSLARPRDMRRSRLAQAFDRFLLDHGDEFAVAD